MQGVKMPLKVYGENVHWRIQKPKTVVGVIAWITLAGLILGAITGVFAFYQTTQTTTSKVDQLELEQALLKIKVDSLEAMTNTKLTTNRLILHQILRNTSMNGDDADKYIEQVEKAEKESILLADKQRKEREAEIFRKESKKIEDG